jgi:hypothetical protein
VISTDAHGHRYLLAEYADSAIRHALWRYEVPGSGVTYVIACTEEHWQVGQEYWDSDAEDGYALPLAITVEAFLRLHTLHGLVR